jgi:hypothetical protein
MCQFPKARAHVFVSMDYQRDQVIDMQGDLHLRLHIGVHWLELNITLHTETLGLISRA